MGNKDGRPQVSLQHDADIAFDDLDVRIADNKAAFLLNVMLLIAHNHVEASIQQEVGTVRLVCGINFSHLSFTECPLVGAPFLFVKGPTLSFCFLGGGLSLRVCERDSTCYHTQVQRQVSTKVPTLGNQLLHGLPVQADVLGLTLNISMQA